MLLDLILELFLPNVPVRLFGRGFSDVSYDGFGYLGTELPVPNPILFVVDAP